MNLHKDGITQTVINTIMLCPRKAQLKYIDQLDNSARTATPALRFGSIFHNCLELIYGNADYTVDDAVDAINEQEKERLREGIAGPSAFSDLAMTIGQVRVMLNEYNVNYPDEFNWLDLEREFSVDHEGITLRGKFDGVFRAKDGKLWLYDTKTKAVIDDDSIVDILQFDLQVNMYLYAMTKVYNEVPGGVMYNLVRRPQLRQGKNETFQAFLVRISMDVASNPDKYFKRHYVTVIEEDLNNWVNNDFENMINLTRAWSTGNIRFRNGGACTKWNTTCEFMRYCAYGDKTGLVTRDALYPELTAEVEIDGSP